MVGLALSMGATSLLVPRQGDSAGAAESKVPEANPSSVSHVAALPGGPSVNLSTTFSTTGEYVVREGQTLQQIAEHYHINVEALAVANELTPTSPLRAGQVLKIPTSGSSPSRLSSTRPARLLASADASRLPAPVDVSNAAEGQRQASRAQAFDRLKQERNKLKNSLAELRSGESRIVAASSEVKTEPKQIAQEPNQILSALPTLTTQPSPSIASLPSPVASPVPDASLVAASPSSDPDWMRVNQSLVLAPEQAATTPAVRQAEIPAASSLGLPNQPAVQSTAALPPSSTTLSSASAYQVSVGDTAAKIARSHNIPLSALISANRLSDPNVIFVGQVLQVPSTQSSAVERQASPQVPSVLPVSTASASNLERSNIAIPTVPTRNGAERPQTVAVVPSSILPAPSATPDTTVAPEIRPGSTSAARNPYVQALLSEVKAMRGRSAQSVASTQQPIVVAAATATTSTAASLGNTVIAPQANPERVPQALRTPVQSTPTVVATAPLGSENYEPLLKPITGRMVSPDLPSLPAADHFLPDGVLNGYIWPARGQLTSGYGWRWGRMHRGIDIASDIGTPIHAAASGVIEYAGWNSGGYGNMVEIRHSDGSMTRYAHMNAIYVQEGQRVSQSQQIGEMGSTGYSTGPHLHFEVHPKGGDAVNPMAYLPAQ